MCPMMSGPPRRDLRPYVCVNVRRGGAFERRALGGVRAARLRRQAAISRRPTLDIWEKEDWICLCPLELNESAM